MKGPSLVGMVIATYEWEPYAHIISSRDLFGDIKQAVPQATTVHFDGKVSPLIWSEWSRYAKTSTPFGQPQGSSGLGKTTNTIPKSETNRNLAEQGVVNIMLAERISKNRSTIPLSLTPEAYTKVQEKLTKLSQGIEKVARVLHPWYSLTKDTVRARAFVNLVSITATVYRNGILIQYAEASRHGSV